MKLLARNQLVRRATVGEVAGIAAGVGIGVYLRHPRGRGGHYVAAWSGNGSDAQGNNREDTSRHGESDHGVLHSLTYYLL